MTEPEMKIPDSKRRRKMQSSEARALARGCANGSVCGSWMKALASNEALEKVFVPLTKVTQREKIAMGENGVVHFYEYTDKAVGVDEETDLPIFHSMRYVYFDETEELTRQIRTVNVLAEKQKEKAKGEITNGHK